MGVPGPVTSAQSQGVHQLIRTGAASLVTYGDEVLEIVGDDRHPSGRPRRALRRDPATGFRPAMHRVLDAVPLASPAPVDSIAITAGMALLDVQSALRRLVRDGLVELSERGWRLTPAANE